MTSLNALAEQVMGLPVAQRLSLVSRVLASVDAEGDPSARAEWEREICARIQRYDDDPAIGIPGSSVFAELDAKLKK